MKKSYTESVHFYGRIWVALGIFLMLMVPVAACVYYDAWPQLTHVLKGLLGVAPIFWTVGIIEVFTYAPMLGTGGTYLGFITGNLTSLKVPAALNAMQAANVEATSEEGEVISTIAIATSAIVTTLVIALGVLMLGYLQPILESPVLQPAFDNILPALFGGLGVVYISKNWKIAVAPILLMLALFIFIPAMNSGTVGIMVPVSAVFTIAVARILYKRGVL